MGQQNCGTGEGVLGGDQVTRLEFTKVILTRSIFGLAMVPDTFSTQLLEQALSPATLSMVLVAAHMIIFWLSQTSNVTPPIALAAFAGAGVAGAPPMRTAVEAFKLANGLFVIPLMMAYTPLLLGGDNGWYEVFFAGVVALAMVVAIAMLTERFLFTALDTLSWILGLAAIVCLLVPDAFFRGAGVFVVASLVLVNWWRSRQ